MSNEVKQTWFFQQPPREVWEYLTQPELLEQWLGKTDFQPIVGHKFRFESPYGNHSSCEVLEIKPFTTISFSWRKNSASDKKPFDSTVRWTLLPKDSGTELQLVHTGFRTTEDATGHENGWDGCYQQLKGLLNAVTP